MTSQLEAHMPSGINGSWYKFSKASRYEEKYLRYLYLRYLAVIFTSLKKISLIMNIKK